MAELTRPDGTLIHYEVTGSGYPILALAPGGVASRIDQWQRAAINPVEAFSDEFMVIVMDQRYAGRSRAPLTPFSYEQSLGDQLAVLDTVGATGAHLVAADVGSAHGLRLLYEAPARISAAVLLDPVGLDTTNSMDTFFNMFNETIRTARAEGLDAVVQAAIENPDFCEGSAAGPWAQRLHDDTSFRDTLRSLGRETYIALVVDFRDGIWPWSRRFFSVNDVAVGRNQAPLLVFPGDDPVHPAGVGQTIATDAPQASSSALNARAADTLAATLESIRRFLRENSPA